MGQIKAIGFDYGGVIGGDATIGKRFTKLNSQMLGITEEVWRQKYFAVNHLLHTGKITSKREFWSLFLKDLGKEDKLDELIARDKALSAEYTAVNQELLVLVDRLRRNGYKVGLLSNATIASGQMIRKLGVESHFDAFLISAEIGVQKPDPQAFQQLAKLLEVDLAELAFIDDVEVSLSTAKECGYTPILFVSYDKLLADLKKLNITQAFS